MFAVRGKTAHLAWYRTDDAAAEVAFLHGSTDSAQCWGPLLRAMPGVRALAFDARAHGESGLPAEDQSYDVLRDDAARVLSSQPGDGGFVVVGHSLGAMTAAYLAASRPDLVRAVVLEDPPSGEPQPDQEGTSQKIPTWLEELLALDVPARIAKGRSDNPAWPEDELEPWAVSVGQFNPSVLERPFQPPTPLTDQLAAITCPVLLIHGDPDRGSLISPAYANRCAEAAAGDFQAVHIPNTGHSVHRDNRPQFVAELTTFLNQHR